ncbi:hypothetical protein [Oceanithermus sp.]|uniref:hypothetical protein n=1 Tax=Oceanithermus sp. TaxID=2268145 RepID=UPI0025F53DC0|nr:hypothetical protein [Oceanithermus sp.]
MTRFLAVTVLYTGALLLGSPALAQLPLQVLYPSGSALELSAREVVFDLVSAGFPPRDLPAYYPPHEPEGPIVLRLFSNVEEAWVLSAELEPLASKDGRWLPPDRIELRLDGGPWLPLGSRTVLLMGSGPTGGYEEHRLEVRLKVVGDEVPGTYSGALVLSLSRL